MVIVLHNLRGASAIVSVCKEDAHAHALTAFTPHSEVSDSEFSTVDESSESSVCKLYSKLVHGQNHWILHCKTLFDALNYSQPLISEQEQAEVDEKESVSGMQEKSNREMLQNIITFSIRFYVHKSRRTAFNNPISAKAKVINIAKHKIRSQI